MRMVFTTPDLTALGYVDQCDGDRICDESA